MAGPDDVPNDEIPVQVHAEQLPDERHVLYEKLGHPLAVPVSIAGRPKLVLVGNPTQSDARPRHPALHNLRGQESALNQAVRQA